MPLFGGKFRDPVEVQYQRQRQTFLAKQDVLASRYMSAFGIVLLVSAVLKWWQSRSGGTSELVDEVVAIAFFVALCLAPQAVKQLEGSESYVRRRTRRVLLFRLLFLLPLYYASHLSFTPPANISWRALFVGINFTCRGFFLTATALSLQLPPKLGVLVQAVTVGVAMNNVPGRCKAAFGHMPAAQEALKGLCSWLGSACGILPVPLPPLELPPQLDPCVALVYWVQVFGLFVLPQAVVLVWELKARREFMQGLPASRVPSEERRWWAGLRLPPAWWMCVMMLCVGMASWQAVVLVLVWLLPAGA